MKQDQGVNQERPNSTPQPHRIPRTSGVAAERSARAVPARVLIRPARPDDLEEATVLERRIWGRMAASLNELQRRLFALPEAFLTTDAILRIVHNLADGLVVFPAMVARNLEEELPLMASEAILMEAVRRGSDRQAVHERLRLHARAAATAVFEEGGENPFISLVAGDAEVPLDLA